jgi:hypothetical protein
VSPSRLVAIGFIYCCTAVAWGTLGSSVVVRTGETDGRLAQEVALLWGGRHEQLPPDLVVERPRTEIKEVEVADADGNLRRRRVSAVVIDRVPVPLRSSRVHATLALDPRRKGLLWYNTYAVAFRAEYTATNPDAEPRTLEVHFPFPSSQALYDAFAFKVNGQEAPPATDLSKGLTHAITVAPHASISVEATYRSRGLGAWTYAFAPAGISQVRDFQMEVATDFTDVDFPAGTLSPTSKARDGRGWRLQWAFDSLVTGQKLGVDPPSRLNPGPLAARITFFAPVALLFFVTVVAILGVARGRSLHPMHYFFLSAAFFAFHLLLAYLVDHMELGTAFLIASATSLFLVVSYLRVIGGVRFALLEAGTAQFVFLVLFSYSFFFEGYTGLTIAIGAVVTLYVLMQLTARIDWEAAFAPARGGDAASPGR